MVAVTGIGRVCGTSASSAPDAHQHLGPDVLGEAQQLDDERPPAHRRLDPVDQDDVAGVAGAAGDQQPGRRPDDPARAVVADLDRRPVDLEVVVVLGVERRDRLGVPLAGQLLDGAAGRLAGVVPALEGRDHHRVAQLRHVAPARSPATAYGPPSIDFAHSRTKGPFVSTRSDLFRRSLTERVLVADGAMGTMLQAANPTLEDFEGLEGCNEILNLTRPDIVRSVHDAYFEVGVDAVETNTFGANLGNLGEYDIPDRAHELAEAGARIARAAADAWSTAGAPPFRHRLGRPRHEAPVPRTRAVRRAPRRLPERERGHGDRRRRRPAGGDRPGPAAGQGRRRRRQACPRAHSGEDLPVLVQVTVETTGTMLLGSEIGAALTALEPLGIDAIGLNCATGPSEMSEHLRSPGQARARPDYRACRTPASRSSPATVRTTR